MLLDKSNFPDDQKVLVLSIALSKVKDDNNITPGDIEAAMRRIQGTNSTPTSTGDVFESEHENFNWVDRQSLSTGEKEELVEYAMLNWQNRRHQNSWNGNTTKQYGKSYMNTNTRGGHNNHNNPNYNRRNVSPHTMLNPRDIQTGDIMQCHAKETMQKHL